MSTINKNGSDNYRFCWNFSNKNCIFTLQEMIDNVTFLLICEKSEIIRAILIYSGVGGQVDGVWVSGNPHTHAHTHLHIHTCMHTHTNVKHDNGCPHGIGHLKFLDMYFQHVQHVCMYVAHNLFKQSELAREPHQNCQ